MKKRRILAAQLIELGPEGSAPVAFRIWKAGRNMTDDGPTIFSERSAKLLMAEQARRGNIYSSDYDHLSLLTNRPATAGQASGWHRLEVRDGEDGPELWAVDVEWCAEAKAGIEAKPPKWRYFSPAYDIDPETREVISYLNLALCINPKTWHNNALASRAVERATMKKSAMLAALKAMAEGEGDEEQKKAAAALFASLGGDDALKAAQAEEEGKEDENEGKSEEPTSGEKKPPVSDKREDRRDARTPEADKATVDLALRVANIETLLAANAVKELIDKHADRFSPSTRAWALTQSLAVVQSYVKAAPKLDTRAPQTAPATRGEGQGSGEPDATIGAEVDKALGITPERKGAPGFGKVEEGRRVLNARRPSEIRAMRGQKEE